MAIKRMKFERKLKNAKPDPAQLTPPPPDATNDLASEGVSVARGNSNLEPLSPKGEAQTEKLSAELARKGGVDSVVASTAKRAQQTADNIQKSNPVADRSNEPGLESWAQGNMEGQPKELVRKQIRDLIRQNPNYKIPGQGAMSTRQGESFNQFRQRALSSIRGVMQMKANAPNKMIAVPTHSTVINLVKSWLANGAPDDLSIKPEAMEEVNYGEPGSVAELAPDDNGEWQMKELDTENAKPFNPRAILLVRHGMTPENTENYKRASDGQSSLGRIAKYAGALDFGRVRAEARRAASSGVSDDDISDIIDDSLPNAKDAEDLPMHHLLAVASAASPKKQKEYAPLIQKYFGNLKQLPPDVQQQIAQHLGQIGLQNPPEAA